MIDRRTFFVSVAAISTHGWAQDGAFPDRPIKIVVPNLPGGPSDIVGRYLAESMRSSLGQPLIIDNRPGAAGLIGTALVANSAPDGYTVLLTSRSNHVMAPLVQKQSQVDPQRDLAPVEWLDANGVAHKLLRRSGAAEPGDAGRWLLPLRSQLRRPRVCQRQ